MQPPRLTRDQRASLLRDLARHGCPTWQGADMRAEAEGLELYEGDFPRRCGVHEGRRIYLPRGLSEREADLVIDHERVHAWIETRALVDATEADAWIVTADAVWSPGAVRPMGFPDWFLDVVEIAREPCQCEVIGKVIGWC